MRLSPWLSCIVTMLIVGLSMAACQASGGSGSTSGGLSGQSCSKTADCGGGLACVAGACVSERSHPGTSAEAGAPASGGSPGSGGSGSGGAGGADGGPGTPGRSSALGESCNTTSDCGMGLVCWPREGTATGVCDLASYGVTPTGKTCTGECNTPADCCEMPVGVTLTATTGGQQVSIHQCADILALVLNGDTSACANQPGPATATGIGCFYYQTYCMCGGSTWTCTNNRCSYTASCSVNEANQLGGCPSQTRTGAALASTCDTTANTCAVAAATGCASDSDCGNGHAVADVAGATCRNGDCTCHQTGCYLKCAQDLDCQEGYTCDTTTKLCQVAAACTGNEECRNTLHNVLATCTNGACGVPCTTDHDCSPSGAIPSLGEFNGTVCGPGGVCAAAGCSSDQDCEGSTSTVHTFCVTPPTGSAGMVVHSAVTS